MTADLALAMVVKNAAHGIVRTLSSVAPAIDNWAVIDTGSTDGTQDLVTRTLRGRPGRVASMPFEDFAATRNNALAVAELDADWVLMLSVTWSSTRRRGSRGDRERAGGLRRHRHPDAARQPRLRPATAHAFGGRSSLPRCDARGPCGPQPVANHARQRTRVRASADGRVRASRRRGPNRSLDA